MLILGNGIELGDNDFNSFFFTTSLLSAVVSKKQKENQFHLPQSQRGCGY